MQIVRFDKKPAIIHYNADGTYYFNTNIKEVEVEQEDNSNEKSTQFEALQFVIQNPLTKDNIKRTVILEYWDKDEQEKLINEYNSAILGVITSDEDKEKALNTYKSFLEERKKTS